MKSCGTFAFFLCCTVLVCASAVAQNGSTDAQPASGRIDEVAYRNTYFGFSYFIPEQWVARGTASKQPSATNGYLLLTLKRKVANDPLSSVMISATQLGPYGGDLLQYLDKRYRLHDDDGSGTSDTTINGISTSRRKRARNEPEYLVMHDRVFYRVDTEWSGINRVAIATEQRGYALIFELIVPTRFSGETVPGFVDSLHSLSFSAPPEPARTEKK